MNLLVFVCLAIACTTATYAPYGYAGPYSKYGYHVPVIGPNGVPQDTPEVQHARASHLSALAAAGGHLYPTGNAYTNHYGSALIAHDGTPLDTPEVAAAKSHHFAAFNQAAARNGVYSPHILHHSTGPVETPEVQHAKAAHFAAHAEANARSGHHGHYRKRRDVGLYPYAYGYHVPVIGPNGVPVETPEVQHAKAAHFAAHAAAAARGVYGGHIGPGVYGVYGGYAHAYPLHYPVIGPNGVPVDTPEVQHARAAHFAALAAAAARSGQGYYGGHY